MEKEKERERIKVKRVRERAKQRFTLCVVEIQRTERLCIGLDSPLSVCQHRPSSLDATLMY